MDKDSCIRRDPANNKKGGDDVGSFGYHNHCGADSQCITMVINKAL